MTIASGKHVANGKYNFSFSYKSIIVFLISTTTIKIVSGMDITEL